MNRLSSLAATAMAFGLVQAALADDFPPDSSTPTAEEIKKHVIGNGFTYTLKDGNTVRVQFNSSGYFFVDARGGYQDSGDWRAEEGKLCGTLRKSGDFCNDARLQAGVLLLKRMNGEIIRYQPK